MGTVTIQGLGDIEIAGDSPTSQEMEVIKNLVGSNTESFAPENILSIQDYKKENPELVNVPDLKLAEDLYEKKFKGKIDEETFYKTVFPNIQKEDSESAAYATEEFKDMVSYLPAGKELTIGALELGAEEFVKPEVKDIAETTGVSINDAASSDARFGASLGYDQSQKILAIKKTLSESFNQNVDVRIGPNTGELEYYHPEKKQYALVDAPGFDKGDFADMGGDAMVIVPDIAATLVVGLTTWGAGAIPAGAAAAMLGEYSRLKLGQSMYGINKDLTDEELFKSTRTAGLYSLGGGYLGLGIVRSLKGVNNLINGRVVPSDIVDNLDNVLVKEADQISETINNVLDKAKIMSKVEDGSGVIKKSKLKYTLAEATDDADLLATQEAFENTNRLGYTGEFRTFGRVQAEALNNYFRVLKSGFGTMKNVTPKKDLELIGKQIAMGEDLKIPTNYNAGLLIQKVVKDSQDPIIKNIVKKQMQSDELLTKSVFNLPDGSVKTTGVEARSIIRRLGDEYKINVDKAGKSLDAAAGVKMINTDIIAKAISKLSEKETLSFVNAAKAEGIFKKKLFNQFADKNGSIPLARARETIKSLTQLIQDKGIIGSPTGENVVVGKLMALKSAFMKQVKQSAPKAYVDELENFNDLVIRNKRLLDNETISKITSREDGILRIADEAVFETTFKTGPNAIKAAREVFDVIKNSPDALTAYKNSIYEFYKTKVLTNGIPNRTKHNAFIKKYEAPIRQFFNKAEFDKLSRIDGLKKIIENNAKINKQTTDNLFKSFEGKLESGTPQEIFYKIYQPENIGEIIKLKNILKNNPEVYEAFQRNVLTDLNEKVMTTEKRLGMKILNPTAFDNYLNGKGGERGYRIVLEQIFGKEYVANLDILNEALQISARKAPQRKSEGVVGNFFTDIIRARIGQFSKPGRFFTAARRIFSSAANRVIKNSLLNPESLKLLIELKNLKPRSKKIAIILGKLGGDIFFTSDDEYFNPPEKKSIDDQSSNTSNIEEIIQTTDNVMTASLPNTIETGNTAQLPPPPPLDTVGANPAFFNDKIMAQTPNSNTMLSASDEAFLDDEEKAMRERGVG